MIASQLLLVGNPEPTHLGGHLLDAARELRLDVRVADIREAFDAPAWQRRFNWWLRGHRPSSLRRFSEGVIRAARISGAKYVLATGIAPIDAPALRELGLMGVRRLNFLTDDPWNPQHRARWFMRALREYDHVFSPRRANLRELSEVGGPRVSYLPFAYAPDIHYPETPATPGERQRFGGDLAFVGGADADRVEAVTPFIAAGVNVALYGGYWDRYRATRPYSRGFASEREVRKAIGGAAVSLCLVRKANRDGHAMRSFEVAAMAGCMLVEDTTEHREIFGVDGDAVMYYGAPAEGVERVRALLADEHRRRALSERVRALVLTERHTYASRLMRMLSSDQQAVA